MKRFRIWEDYRERLLVRLIERYDRNLKASLSHQDFFVRLTATGRADAYKIAIQDAWETFSFGTTFGEYNSRLQDQLAERGIRMGSTAEARRRPRQAKAAKAGKDSTKVRAKVNAKVRKRGQ